MRVRHEDGPNAGPGEAPGDKGFQPVTVCVFEASADPTWRVERGQTMADGRRGTVGTLETGLYVFPTLAIELSAWVPVTPVLPPVSHRLSSGGASQ